MFTKEKIYNIVLNNLGISAVVQNTNDSNPRVAILNNNYDIALEQVMKDYDWNFLNRKKELTLSTEESPDPNYQYAYDYPNDCVAIRQILDKNDGKFKKFDVSTDSRGNRIILCNVETAIASYTRKLQKQITEVYFTSEFVTALAFYLAFLTAEPLTGKTNKKQLNFQSYQLALAKAKAMNANESKWQDENDSTYIDDRN